MLMPVMDVRKMGMRVTDRHVAVLVRMRSTNRNTAFVLVLMMSIVNVLVLVFDGFVRMCVFVILGQMQPDARSHECRRGYQWDRNRLAE
jgi:hypothetical protein